MKIKRAGFYVNGRWYSLAHGSQALARSRFLSKEYGRPILVDVRNSQWTEGARVPRGQRSSTSE